MTAKGMETAAVGIAAVMAAGTVAYMTMKKSPIEVKMKKLKKSTGKALKNVGTIANGISGFMK